MNSNVIKLYYCAKRKYFAYKNNGKTTDIILATVTTILMVVVFIIMSVFGFVDGLFAPSRPSEEELQEKYRLRNIARENSAASIGQNVGRQKFYDRRREIRQEERELSPLERIFR